MAINLSNPVNWQSPLNRGLKMWHIGHTSTTGKSQSKDIVGGFDGAFSGAPTWARLPNGFYGLSGSASPYVTISHSTKYKSSSTVSSCWFYTTDVAISYQCVWTIWTSDSDALELFLNYTVLGFGNYPWQAYQSGISANTWYFIQCEANGTSRKMWVNGVPSSTPSGTSSGYSGASNTASLGIMARTSGTPYACNGTVGDFRLANDTAISDDMAMRHYNAARMQWFEQFNRTKKRPALPQPAAASFQSAWARNSNTIIQPLVSA